MIRPLDLQTLFMNLDKVGKEQANTKEAQVQAQANQVQKIQKEHDQGQHVVGKTNAAAGVEGDESVKVDADGSSPHSGERRRPRSGTTVPGQEKEDQDNAWKDPELGKHVDLSG